MKKLTFLKNLFTPIRNRLQTAIVISSSLNGSQQESHDKSSKKTYRDRFREIGKLIVRINAINAVRRGINYLLIDIQIRDFLSVYVDCIIILINVTTLVIIHIPGTEKVLLINGGLNFVSMIFRHYRKICIIR
jgi:hypothetical protein